MSHKEFVQLVAAGALLVIAWKLYKNAELRGRQQQQSSLTSSSSSSCSSSSSSSSSSGERKHDEKKDEVKRKVKVPADNEKSTLLQTESKIRKQQISNIHYNLELTFVKKAETYQGDVKIIFDFEDIKTDQGLFLNFTGKEITKIILNDQDFFDEVEWKAHRLHLPKSKLRKFQNVLLISYTNDYDHHGEGLHQYKDPEDDSEYLYTNFEPFECHRMIPSFDQPNLKATFTFSAKAPEDWAVISNDVVSVKEHLGKKMPGYNSWKFSPTPAISTYLFAVVAGDYQQVSNVYDDGRVPLTIWARKSKMNYVDHEEIFSITKSGLAFFEQFFGMPFPFRKYDQIFCPEFNWGAMENVGAVTFSENYLFVDKPTTAQRAKRADTILHEMAHMWFGNLVSPEWWDGLWLNESFATYMAALATAESTEFGQLSWQNFNSNIKSWAYRTDQLTTTHPIQGDVPDPATALANFDGITYGKGASLIKQLVYVLGPKTFQKGMKYYFNKYKWSNTTINDFLEALEFATEETGTFNSKTWSAAFLETAGLNSLRPTITYDEQKIASFGITQTAIKEHPTLRPHAVEVALFDFDEKDEKVSLRTSLRVHVEAKEETDVPELKDVAAPKFVYVNYNDHAFVKAYLDAGSWEFALTHLEKFDDILLRQQLWYTFYTETRDGNVISTEYLKLTQNKIGFEKNPKLVSAILERALMTLSSFVPRAQRETLAEPLFNLALEQTLDAKVQEWWSIWADTLTRLIQSKTNLEKLLPYLNENAGAFPLSQAMRWRLIIQSAAYDLPAARSLLDAEKAKDKSDRGQNSALTAEAAFPDAKKKEEAWKRFIDPETDKKTSLHNLGAEMDGFRLSKNRDVLTPYNAKYFEEIEKVFKTRNSHLASSFAGSLFPYDPEDEHVLKSAEALVAKLSDKDDVALKRQLKESIDDLHRAIKAISLFETSEASEY